MKMHNNKPVFVFIDAVEKNKCRFPYAPVFCLDLNRVFSVYGK